ncbi:MAG: anthranilate phosphoribosyltransferase [Burkholderiaceae bacterium]|nr:MAG: anthranilate phosphoribosyltransferase [Burkholderiaceae bacterium]
MNSVLTSPPNELNVQKLLEQVISGNDLDVTETRFLIKKIMKGEIAHSLTAGILVALKMKGEAVSELLGGAEVMRDLVKPVDSGSEDIVDLCGTGGDGAQTFNISTAAMFVAASAGAKVAKHGGRAVSSSSGSADLLECLGANINLTPEQVVSSLQNTGVGFMFAPNHHPAMKNVAPVRRELGTRTMFNILGPLTNPAKSRRQLIGVYDKKLLVPLANVLKRLGSTHVLVVHGESGLDEMCFSSRTYYAELKKGKITEGIIVSDDLGFDVSSFSKIEATINVSSVDESKKKVIESLTNKDSLEAQYVILNAAGALYVAGYCDSVRQGVVLAKDSIASGNAIKKLEEFVKFTQAIDN